MIARIEPSLLPLRVWLSDSIGGTGHKTQYRRGTELCLDITGGHSGLGEASPLPRFSAEHQEDVDSELERLQPFEAELPSRPAACRHFIVSTVGAVGCRTASARFALEGALIDLCAKHLNLPAPRLIAEIAQQPMELFPELAVSRLLHGSDRASLLSQARRAMTRGYRTFKLKLGTVDEFDRDLENIQALRQQFGSSVGLRLDPNGGWPFDEVPRLLDRLQFANPEFVEEPAPCAQLIELGRTPVPLALDESLRDRSALESVAPHLQRLGVCAVIVKPALLGLIRALDLTAEARRLGLTVVITHLFDGPVGHATAASVALAVGGRDRAQGLAPHAGLLLNPRRRVRGLGAGRLNLVEQNGLPLAELSSC